MLPMDFPSPPVTKQSSYESKSPDQKSPSKPTMPDVKQYTAYIRQHPLKYVPSPPHPSDEAYHTWHQKLKKVENILHKKYMNKLARTINQYENIKVAKSSQSICKPTPNPKHSEFTIPITPPTMGNAASCTSNCSDTEEMQQIIYNLQNIINEQSIKLQKVSDKSEEHIGFISALQKQNLALQTEMQN